MPYQARFNCPGCGSPLTMQEGTISLRCSYCNLSMRVGAPGRILKYVYHGRMDQSGIKVIIEHHLKERGELQNFRQIGNQLFFLPFYRFRGMTYALLSEKKIEEEDEEEASEIPPVSKIVFHQKCRHFDLTIPAFTETAFGLDSLGVRPEVVPLDFFSPETIPAEAALVDLAMNPEDAKQIALGMFAFNLGFSLEGKECIRTEMIGEGLSVIYHPVWAGVLSMREGARTFFIDGLSRRVIRSVEGAFEYQPSARDESRADNFSPVPHKCPNCGQDLPTSENSLIYYCPNCYRLYIIEGDAYKGLQVKCAVYEQSERKAPFWRFPFSTGRGLKTVSGFAGILTGEIPLIARIKANNPFYLYVPAFKLPDLDNLTARGIRLCRTQPAFDFSGEGLAPGADAVLPESEALELARYYWEVMRSRYRQLNTSLYDFNENNIERGELVWLSMSGLMSGPGKKVRGQSAYYA